MITQVDYVLGFESTLVKSSSFGRILIRRIQADKALHVVPQVKSKSVKDNLVIVVM